MNAPHTFAMASRDEVWSGGIMVERRIGYGEARRTREGIVASDALDLDLREACDIEFATLLNVMRLLGDATVRAVASVRRVDERTRLESSLSVTIGGVSLVSDAMHAADDAALLRALVLERESEEKCEAPRELPIVWRNGSAAVLLHEAVGHAAEHRHEALEWPTWLRVDDEPLFAFDDCGLVAAPVDLFRAPPRALRCETVRDVPLPRMSSLVARQERAPFALPERRVEVQLVDGGAYEPLTGDVTLRIAIADLVEGDRVQRVQPFVYRSSRRAIATSLIGATGGPLRYPGVICRREGQELAVGSFAPLMVTRGW